MPSIVILDPLANSTRTRHHDGYPATGTFSGLTGIRGYLIRQGANAIEGTVTYFANGQWTIDFSNIPVAGPWTVQVFATDFSVTATAQNVAFDPNLPESTEQGENAQGLTPARFEVDEPSSNGSYPLNLVDNSITATGTFELDVIKIGGTLFHGGMADIAGHLTKWDKSTDPGKWAMKFSGATNDVGYSFSFHDIEVGYEPVPVDNVELTEP